jgi:putative addiction module component (TIGR02574 family)
MNAIAEQIQVMGVHEKMQLVSDLWDSIEATLISPMTKEVKRELDERRAWALANPGQGRTLSQIADGLGVRL